MKKAFTILSLALALLVCGAVDMQGAKKKAAAKKKTTSTLPVTKGAVKTYGDYLTTQLFTIKKGKESGLVLEYPISGNPQLVNSIREYIKERLNPDFTGSLATPEALMRSVMKGKSDVKPGGLGESLEDEVKVTYSTPEVITFEGKGYWYGGGAHGEGWDTGATFLVEDGTVFDESMFPSIQSFRDEILKAIAREVEMEVYQLDDILYSPSEIDYPGTILIKEDGINFLYQPYEIAPYAAGLIKGVLGITWERVRQLSPAGQRFFAAFLDSAPKVMAPPPPAEQERVESKARPGSEEIFNAVEQPAQFPGGQSALMKWLANNIRYPEAAQKNGVSGRVIVKFVVEKDGSISGATIVKGVDKDLDAEALRLVKGMPKWQPGKNNGQAVRSYYTLPVTFKLTEPVPEN